MDKNSYLIPANSKKSILKFGIFNTLDLIIFGTGLGVTLLLMMALPVDKFGMAIFAISPGLICAFLVIPIPNYHNIRTVIANAWNFYTTRQKYIWKGWCFDNGETDKE